MLQVDMVRGSLVATTDLCLLGICAGQVVNFIRKKGRVTLAELAAESNKLINLNATTSPKEVAVQETEKGGGS